MSRLTPIGLFLLPCLGWQMIVLEKAPMTEVAAIETKSACADYDAKSLRSAGLVSVAAPLRVSATRACFQTSLSDLDPPQPPEIRGENALKVPQPPEIRGENALKVPLIKGDLGGSPGLKTSPNCPADVETLTALLIRDLPSYANRVIQQSRNINRKIGGLTQVIIAGRPEFTPLPLSPSQYSSFTPATESAPPQQVFFTTLERQYVARKAAESQHFHWLFLSQTPDGWRLAMMFSQFGSSEKGSPPTPPQESSNGIMGQAVTTWLRDCRAGAIRPLRK